MLGHGASFIAIIQLQTLIVPVWDHIVFFYQLIDSFVVWRPEKKGNSSLHYIF